MNSKYIGRTLPIGKELLEVLVRVQKRLTDKLGFEPSLAETVAYCARQTENSDVISVEIKSP